MLRAHPVLLLAGLPTDVMVRRLLHAWNPCAGLPDIADGVRVRVVRSTITSVLAKPDPAAAREAANKKEQVRAKAETKE